MDGRDASDAELVARARGGDRAALAALVRRHRPLADAVCLGLLRRREVAEDAVQEAVVAAMVGLERLRRPESFGAWLCGIALNVARRWLREAGQWADGGRPLRPLDAIDPEPGPEQTVLDADRAARVRRAVAELPPGQREAISLFYLAERSGPEVAEALAISTTATKARLHKGRHALRQKLVHEREDHVVTTSVEMHVADVRREPPTAEPVRRHAIVLEDQGGGRRLPIYVGEPEATAIALRLTEAELPRPMTHLLLTNVIDALGGRVTEVRVTRLAERTFFGEIELDGPRGPVAVDARPSDAINLALLTGAPIRVERAVLDEVESAGGRALGDDELTEGTHQIAEEFQAALAHALRRFEDDPKDDPEVGPDTT